MQTAANAMAKGYAFSVYGENVIILVQNAIIIVLIWNFDKSIDIMQKMLVFTYFVSYAYFLFASPYLTPELWELISSSGLIL